MGRKQDGTGRIRAMIVDVVEQGRDTYDGKPSIRFTGRVVTCTAWGSGIKNPGHLYSDDTTGIVKPFDDNALSYFEVNARASASFPDLRPYGLSAEFRQVYDVNLERAETMVRVLRAVEKSLEAAYQSDGPADSPGIYFRRVARAIGCSAFLSLRSTHGSSYSDNEYRVEQLGPGGATLDWRLEQWQAKQREASHARA